MSWGFGSGPLCLGKARLCSCAEQRLLWVLAVPGWLCSVVAAVPHLCVLSVVPGQHIRHRRGISSPRAGRMEPLPWKPRLWFPWQPAGVHTRLRLAHGGDSGHHQGQGQGLAGAVTLGELAWAWESWAGAGRAGCWPCHLCRLCSISSSGGLGVSVGVSAVNRLLVAAEEHRPFSTIPGRNAQN